MVHERELSVLLPPFPHPHSLDAVFEVMNHHRRRRLSWPLILCFCVCRCFLAIRFIVFPGSRRVLDGYRCRNLICFRLSLVVPCISSDCSFLSFSSSLFLLLFMHSYGMVSAFLIKLETVSFYFCFRLFATLLKCRVLVCDVCVMLCRLCFIGLRDQVLVDSSFVAVVCTPPPTPKPLFCPLQIRCPHQPTSEWLSAEIVLPSWCVSSLSAVL